MPYKQARIQVGQGAATPPPLKKSKGPSIKMIKISSKNGFWALIFQHFLRLDLLTGLFPCFPGKFHQIWPWKVKMSQFSPLKRLFLVRSGKFGWILGSTATRPTVVGGRGELEGGVTSPPPRRNPGSAPAYKWYSIIPWSALKLKMDQKQIRRAFFVPNSIILDDSLKKNRCLAALAPCYDKQTVNLLFPPPPPPCHQYFLLFDFLARRTRLVNISLIEP